MNLLSISASFGALVFVFQDGHGAQLLGFQASPIDPSTPVIMFCIVFGLSMDFEVLLLSRIQEEYRPSATEWALSPVRPDAPRRRGRGSTPRARDGPPHVEDNTTRRP